MAKYISRIQFEQMKVLKKRGGSNVAVGKALGMSPATVGRNNKYNSYEDYLVSMYGRSSKSQKEVEAKSGPVRIVSFGKKACNKCGATKPLEEFDKVKENRDGHSGMCKECRRRKQREYRRAKTARKAKSRVPERVIEAPSGHIAVYPTSCSRPALPWFDEPESKNDDEEDGVKVNECVYVYDKGRVKRGIVVATNNDDYIVRLDTWFFRKELKVESRNIFRRDEA